MHATLSPSLSLSLTSEQSAHTLFTGQREREKKREREREMQNMVIEFLFLKGMTGALAPFSCLVNHNAVTKVLSVWYCLSDGQSDHRQLMSSSRQTRLECHLWPKLSLNRQTFEIIILFYVTNTSYLQL